MIDIKQIKNENFVYQDIILLKKLLYLKRSSGSSFNSAIRNGWFDECTKHMK